MAASDLQPTADPLQPGTTDVANGDHPAHAETASKLQAAAEKAEKHQAEEMAAPELQLISTSL